MSKRVAAGSSVLGNVGGALFANKAAKQQGRAYRDAQGNLIQLTQDASGELDPYANAGEQALSPLTGLLLGKQYNPETGQFDQISDQQRMNLFQTSPGYKFRLGQAQKAIENSQAARGNLLSGGALKELDEVTQGIASNEYGNYLSQLSGLVGGGQGAATGQARIKAGAAPSIADFGLMGNPSMVNAMQNMNIGSAFQQTGKDMVSIYGDSGGKSSGAASGSPSWLSMLFGG